MFFLWTAQSTGSPAHRRGTDAALEMATRHNNSAGQPVPRPDALPALPRSAFQLPAITMPEARGPLRGGGVAAEVNQSPGDNSGVGTATASLSQRWWFGCTFGVFPS